MSEVVTVYQEGSKPSIVLTQKEYAVGSAGETIKVELKSNVDYVVKMPSEGWITESTSRAYSTHTHYFKVAENDTYEARSAVITFINKENGIEEKVIVTQVQQDAILVAQNEYTLSAKGGTLDFTANTNVDFTVSVSADWIKQVQSRGLTEKPLYFDVAENTAEEAREATITLASGDVKQIITVKQVGKDVFNLLQKEYELTSDGGNIDVSVVSTGEYTVQMPDVDWIKEVKGRAATTTHTFSVSANATYDSREANIVFTHKATGAVETVTVLQAQQDAIIIAKNEYTLTSEGGKLDFTVSTNVDFTVAVSADWIKQVSSRALTDKDLYFDVAKNTGEEAREATITLSSGGLKQVITVKQVGKDVFNLLQTEYTLTSDGGNIEVSVVSTGEYTVQMPDVDWIKEVKGRAATTTHTFSVSANATYDSREANIVFTHKATGMTEKVKIVQAQQDAIIPAQKEYHFAASGGKLDFTVNANVEYTVTVSADWIKQVAARGLTETQLHFDIAENTSDTAREGSITLTSGSLKQVIAVKQVGKDVFAITQKDFKVSATGGNITVEVTSTGDYTVQMPDVAWLTEVKSKAATTSTRTFAIAANNTYDARTAEIVFSHTETGKVEKVTVMQEQLDGLTVSQKEYSLDYAGGNIVLKTNSNVDYTVEISVDWITQITTRGLTEGTLNFNVKENTSDEPREAAITLKAGDLQQVVTIKQAHKPVFSLSQKAFEVSATGGTIQVDVTATGDYTIQMPDVDWITETNARGAASTSRVFTVAANNTYDSRTVEIAFTHTETGNVQKVTVTQAQLNSLTVSQKEFSVKYGGEAFAVTVSSNVEYSVTISADWIKQTATRGLIDKTLNFTAAANEKHEARQATITLTAGDLQQVITVKQAAKPKEGSVDVTVDKWGNDGNDYGGTVQ